MLIDFSRLDQALFTEPAINEDVAYLRRQAQTFIRAVDAQEGLHTEVVLPLPLGTWNAAFILQPANMVLKLSPWSDQFEADFLTGSLVHDPSHKRYSDQPDACAEITTSTPTYWRLSRFVDPCHSPLNFR
jgi:hypothetical protein